MIILRCPKKGDEKCNVEAQELISEYSRPWWIKRRSPEWRLKANIEAFEHESTFIRVHERGKIQDGFLPEMRNEVH